MSDARDVHGARDVHWAGCLCGAVRLRAEGPPLRVGLCHCLDCRKAHGATVVAWAMFRRACVRVAVGAGGLGGARNDRGYRRAFCLLCGSRVFGEYADSDEIELPLGAFDETGLWAPDYENWAIRREPWLATPTVHRSAERNP